PGPACYGMGGILPTVTDANAVLGLLDPDTRLGGTITLDIEGAKRSLAPIAQALGKSVTETALGVHRIANAAMARALRRVTVERGIDGRKCTLLAFGGAGPMHATGLAREVGIRRIIVPVASSTFSAYGCLLSDMSYTQQRTTRLHAAAFDADALERTRAEMQEELSRPLRDQGIATEDIAIEYVGLARYDGQSEAIAVPFDLPFDHGRFATDFNRRHHEIFGYAMDEPWVLEGLRVTASQPSGIALGTLGIGLEDDATVTVAHRDCHFDASGPIRTPCLSRPNLAEGREVVGPAIIVDAWSTTVVPPGWSIESDNYGNLIMSEATP
ncbi:MAG: hydantoinase/oxoprolinase family protein, partial [Proteobacteria bacterium]|nr:hydantoinase/oxoprolinase family protein [Pseudomonadota bacterium]